MATILRHVSRRLCFLALVLVTVILPPAVCAQTITFEGLADGAALHSQYPNVTFSNAVILTSGLSLNEFDFPPHSGVNVAADLEHAISISFASSISNFSGYFTYVSPLTLTAFDAAHTAVQVVHSAYGSNAVSNGAPGSSPNEFLQLGGGAIASVELFGGVGGGSFTVDDISYTFATTAPIPEPGEFFLLVPGFGAIAFWRRRLKACACACVDKFGGRA